MTRYFVLIESPRGIDSTRKCRAKPFQYQRHQPSSQLVLFGQNHHEYLVLVRAYTRNDPSGHHVLSPLNPISTPRARKEGYV